MNTKEAIKEIKGQINIHIFNVQQEVAAGELDKAEQDAAAILQHIRSLRLLAATRTVVQPFSGLLPN